MYKMQNSSVNKCAKVLVTSVKPKLYRLAGGRLRACLRQALMVILFNIPMISSGLTMGWVSVASGRSGLSSGSDSASRDVKVAVSAAVTFCFSLVGVLLSARLLAAGRKVAVIVTSGLFAVCWSLKLYGGGRWIVIARACAGLGSAGAWAVAPLLAKETCSERVSGAAVSALVLASNFGELLMYISAYLHVEHSKVLWCCLYMSVAHCVAFTFVPESPYYLAAQGQNEKARRSLAWWRGMDLDEPKLKACLMDLPIKEKPASAVRLIKNLLSHAGRRRAFCFAAVVVVGQEICGVLALMQFAERVFLLARDQGGVVNDAAAAHEPSFYAVLLGVFQLLAAGISLYFVENVGRKLLLVQCGLVAGAATALGACAVRGAGGALFAAAALGTAVFANSAGLQPAPYALMADMFDYEYRGCVVLLIAVMSWMGNALELVIFPTLAMRSGLSAALVLSAGLTLAHAAFVLCVVPETRGRTTTQIYDEILGHTSPTPGPPLPHNITEVIKIS